MNKYNDGSVIPNLKDNSEWSNLTTGAWCDYNNSDSLGKIYGKLYNWFAVSTNSNKNVSSDSEWKKLTDYLGGESVAGAKLKEVGIKHWGATNQGVSNSTLFTAIPGGYRIGVIC